MKGRIKRRESSKERKMRSCIGGHKGIQHKNKNKNKAELDGKRKRLGDYAEITMPKPQ